LFYNIINKAFFPSQKVAKTMPAKGFCSKSDQTKSCTDTGAFVYKTPFYMPGSVLSPGSFGFENPTAGEEKKTLWAGAARFFQITANYQANSSSTSSTHHSPIPLTSCGDASD
jgi:hypothetical protein